MAASVSSAAPTKELGTTVPFQTVLPWGSFLDLDEYVPELKWQPLGHGAVAVYDMMLNDSQVRGLLSGTVLPIQRFRWQLDPNGARPEIVQGLAKDLNLPVKGEEEGDFKVPRQRNRFSLRKHMHDAFRSLGYGHYFFETVGEVDPDKYGDELWHLVKLAPRPPKTIMTINVDGKGNLVNIKQALGNVSPEIKASNLLSYIWDKEGGNWAGRSMLRSIYRNWVIKDVLMRVDAQNHERNGMGLPLAKAPQDASKPVVDALNEIASKIRAGEDTGVAIPYGADMKLLGVEGTLPDTVASMNFHNEEMAKSFLMMFVNLGTTQTGSRALGSDFIDFFGYAQEAIADWFADTFQGLIEDWVDWNYGENEEQAPLLVYDRVAGEDLPTSELAQLVRYGALQVDLELENYIRRRYKMPMVSSNPAVPIRKPSGTPSDPALQEPSPTVQPSEPSPAAEPATQAGGGRRSEPVRAASEDTPSPIPLPPRKLRRQPYDHEIRASVDFASLDANFNSVRDGLVKEVRQLQAAQIQQLHDAIVEADGDLEVLGSLKADPVAEEVLFAKMQHMADVGVDSAMGEAERQGVKPKRPSIGPITDSLAARAKAVDELLASGISDAAGRRAIRLTGGSKTAKQVAAAVKEHLGSLSDQYLKNQLGGALNQSLNAGRKVTMRQNDPTDIYASELLDEATCDNCVAVDGTEYKSMDDAEGDYPTGGYAECLGEDKCRGTIVATYGSG